jgi:azurin
VFTTGSRGKVPGKTCENRIRNNNNNNNNNTVIIVKTLCKKFTIGNNIKTCGPGGIRSYDHIRTNPER